MLGTVLSALFIGYVLYGLQMAGLVYSGPTALDALLFGTLISATDTVAVLAVLGLKLIGSSLGTFRRSAEELERNLAWVKTTLTHSGR